MIPKALNLMVGCGLQLEPVSGNSCYLVDLMGYRPEQSLIVTAPVSDDGSLPVAEGDEVAVRYLGGDNSFAFYSRVLCIAGKPYPHLHLEYPSGVQGVITRRSIRVPIDGPVMSLAMLDGGQRLNVTMADISVHGARLISNIRLGNVNDTFTIEMPDISAAGEESLALPCVIRHVREQIEMPGHAQGCIYHHGVEFDRLEQAAQLFIARFIQHSVVKQRQH